MILLLAVPTAAGTSIGRDGDATNPGFFLLPPDQRLAFEDITLSRAEAAPVPPAPPELRPNWLLTNIVSGAAMLGSALNSVFDGNHQKYHLGNEGWFGPNTHFGGADKASHFVDYYVVSKEFAKLFVQFGHKPETARWLAAGVSAVTGLVTEIGDGQNRYGFSYEDLVMDVGGALSAALISAAAAEDLIGFRRGLVGFKDCCDYSNELYTADLHLVGLARRLHLDIGPLKYLFFSVTYGTRGYPSDPARQRQVGFEVGLNFKQILDDLGFRRSTWLGYGLHVFFDNVRLPFTAVGYRYDLNAGRWHGPNAGK